ncbi:uncharacterized protein METZ01_LOCUS389713 [marine metagenome]|uniref:Uncharacterized protein n=1 Tax=marine metagenome TaxID=408172 RepID=A0A382URH1_9ZZZZ
MYFPEVILHHFFLHFFINISLPVSTFATGFEKIVGFLKIIEFFLIFIADFFFDNCEICIQPEFFCKSIIFLQVSDLSKIITGKYFFL